VVKFFFGFTNNFFIRLTKTLFGLTASTHDNRGRFLTGCCRKKISSSFALLLLLLLSFQPPSLNNLICYKTFFNEILLAAFKSQKIGKKE
jgi:hypothetical protein